MHRDPNYWPEPLRFSPDRWDSLLQPAPSHPPAPTSGTAGSITTATSSPASSTNITTTTSTSSSSSITSSNGAPAASSTSSSPAGGTGGYPFAAALREMGPNGAYLPFGGGPRNCIGTGFAMMEAILVVAALLQRYELRPAPGGAFPAPKALLTLRPEGVPLRVLARS